MSSTEIRHMSHDEIEQLIADARASTEQLRSIRKHLLKKNQRDFRMDANGVVLSDLSKADYEAMTEEALS